MSSRRTFLRGGLLLGGLLAFPTLIGSVAAQSPRTYDTRGEVRAIRADRSSITIRHEAIPGLMGAMTMPFRLARPSLLDGISVGDQVAFTIARVDGRYVIQSMRRL